MEGRRNQMILLQYKFLRNRGQIRTLLQKHTHQSELLKEYRELKNMKFSIDLLEGQTAALVAQRKDSLHQYQQIRSEVAQRLGMQSGRPEPRSANSITRKFWATS